MDYRDERDALRARAESLEGALSTANAELERMKATEAALEAAKREIAMLRAEVARLRPSSAAPPQKSAAPRIAVFGFAAMAAAFGASILLRSKGAPPPPFAEPAVDGPGTVVAAPPPPPAPTPIVPAKPESPGRSQRAAAARTAHAEWSAVVARAMGAGPAAGTHCKVTAELGGDGSSASVRELEVLCGTTFLYRSTDSFSGVSNSGSGATEEAGKAPGTQRHTVTYQDQGTRSGRAQISLDSAQREAVVWSDNVPTFRVELRVDKLSAERAGDPLVDPENRLERLEQTIVRTGKVTAVTGSPAAASGAACTVDVSPASNSGQNCRVRVRCGGALLYGDNGSGYNQCAIRDGRVGRLVDPRPSATDSDPTLDMDLAENTVVVSDEGDTPWRVNILLDRAAR